MLFANWRYRQRNFFSLLRTCTFILLALSAFEIKHSAQLVCALGIQSLLINRAMVFRFRFCLTLCAVRRCVNTYSLFSIWLGGNAHRAFRSCSPPQILHASFVLIMFEISFLAISEARLHRCEP